MEMNDVDNHIHEIVYQTFSESHTYQNQGFFLGLYRIIALTTFVFGMQGLLQDSRRPQYYEPLLGMNLTTIVLPVVQLAFDEITL